MEEEADVQRERGGFGLENNIFFKLRDTFGRTSQKDLKNNKIFKGECSLKL